MTVFIGTSGWQYRHWRETFYPKGVPQRAWLEYFVERFQTVELNNSFYRLPPPETFEKWRTRTPNDFIFAVKMSRYLTHIKRLRDPEEPIERFLRSARRLGPKLGPVLMQFPPDMRLDIGLLRDALDLWPRELRLTVEFRHETWWVDEVRDLLAEQGVALTHADRYGEPNTALWRTADWGFIRLHEGSGRPHPCYQRKTIENWAKRIATTWGPDDDVYVYFNNDPRACALRDAIWMATAVEKVGLTPTRVPGRAEVTIGGDEEAAWAMSS